MANEQLYRRGEDGIMEKVVVPEARGKAAAASRWLAQGGGNPERMKRGGKFPSGPMKGLSYDQAMQKFEGMWASSPDALKEKYAGRSKTDLAPSEMAGNGVPGLTVGGKISAPQLTQPTINATPGRREVANPQFTARQIGLTPSVPKPSQVSTPATPPSRLIDLPTDERMRAEGKTNAGGVPVNKVPPTMTSLPTDERMNAQGKTAVGGVAPLKTPIAPVGVTGTTPSPRVNSLTGLPMGYRPGDSVAPQFKPAADASVAAQAASSVTGTTPSRAPSILSQSGINRPRTLAPGTNTVEGRAADEMHRQAAINANPGTVNPPGLRLVGPKRPLDELVKRQKLQGIGTPARL